ncbi:ComEA family DNA-binding protein [Mucilaginibacter sp. OK098]|uniref:ComEA family DNA-binding protein n=1 Tax=Mucilaginibacter sp. OK098 TaxID=1855297 RepID=UPI00091A8F26|nr:helix-hairpin-helix domain-containing protein [Mucilaginibacter sp. OK098]SHN13046.1 DNA uptake protein ComE [Mucilaginibacter sp. OK098]
MKTRIKNYLSITKKEWNGMVVLVVLIALVLAAPYGYQLIRKDNTINFKDFDKAVAQLNKAGNKAGYTADNENAEPDKKISQPVMFPFNPNNLTIMQWEQLGLSARQAGVIKHYEDKGGRFYTKEDLKKIYAITTADYQRLEPYIKIPEAVYISKKAKPGEIIELNTADSAKLTELKGIGPGFAVQIIRYRGRLGGFYHKEQLKEVYGIDSLKYDEIRNQVSVNAQRIKKVDLNTISFNQLRIFPYLSYKQVNAIIEYRKQHGNYTSMNDLKNIVLLDEGILRKIEPYLSFK